MRAARVAPAAAALLALAAPLAAQVDEPPRASAPAWHAWLSLSLGLARRQDQPWERIHGDLFSSGWDPYYNPGACYFECQQGASAVAIGRPVAPALALRLRVRGPWQVRLVAAHVPVGAYPGGNNGVALAVRPSSQVIAGQAAWTWRGVWVGAGPALQLGRAREEAGSARQSVHAVRLAASAGLGITVSRGGPWFGEVALERRFGGGSLALAPMPVPGAAALPALRVPLSHTVLSAGVGWRR